MRRTLSLCAACLALLLVTVSARADDQAEARKLIEQAVKAHGGAEALAKQKAGTTTIKGKFYGLGDGIDYTGTVSYQAPDKLRVEITSEVMNQKFTSLQTFNKDKGWVSLNDNVTEMDKDMVAEAQENFHAEAVRRLTPA